jgi:hypothetical protein
MYVSIKMERLRQDFLRFAKLHSWYKHIPFEGMDFFAYLGDGQQPRNGIHAEVEDWHGYHWHFSTSPPKNVISYKVRFGPFLRGTEGYGVRGFHIIVMDAGKQAFQTWLTQEYPDIAEKGELEERGFRDPDVCRIFTEEQNKYWERLKQSVNLKNE